ncbi:expansin-like A1 [Benincasa hispida]|uniref:expansin-like A1 n=1 Tax=Benincasa hispida TaxID=102211 RepID=UPI001901C121|nr:expansin-like A1 [Benincasa hispida]
MIWFLYLLFLFLASSTNACDRCIHQSITTYYRGDSPTSNGWGACRYGSWAMEISQDYYAAAVPSIYEQGAACGACYKVRCKDRRMCTTKGVKVVLTDQNHDNRTDFVLSKKAFSTMARKDKIQKLLNLGTIDVEYKRIPCEYKNKNLTILIQDWSQVPYYFAIKFLYQGGQTQILAVKIAQVGSSKWGYLNRKYGAIWETNKVPQGALKLWMKIVTSGFKEKWIMAKNIIPSDWKSGLTYDMGFQIKDVAQELCPPWECGDQPWI